MSVVKSPTINLISFPKIENRRLRNRDVRFIYRLICRSLLLLISLLISAPLYATSAIDNIRIWPSPTKTRVVFDMDNKTEYSFFLLNDPERMVLDLKRVKLKVNLPLLVTNSEVLTAIRANRPDNNEDARLVFDLNSKITPIVFTLEPSADGRYGYRLVVDFPNDSVLLKSVKARKNLKKEVESTTFKNTTSKNVTVKTERKPQTPLPPSVKNSPAIIKTIPNTLNDVIIAIDAGHGGKDSGAIGPKNTYEKTITLAVATKLVAKINAQPGMKGILIRSSDYFIPLPQRTEMARKYKAHALISIHADGFHQPKPSGASVFVLSTKRANTEIGRWLEKHEEQSELLGGGDLLSTADRDIYLSHTVLDLQFSNSQKEAYGLARGIIGEMKTTVKMHKSKPQYASLAVLKAPDISSLLIELGFITNPKEEILLKKNDYQEKLATSMFKGIYNYFKDSPPEGTAFANAKKSKNNQAIIIHIVRPGEYLSLIAQKYKVSVASIKSLNNLKSDVVKVGQRLKVHGQ